MFARPQVQRSFQKFRDQSSDLQGAVFQTWEESLRHFIDHCQNDPVMKVVMEPLRSHRNVDLSKWYEKFEENNRGMVGTNRYPYSLPTNDDERTALLYQFLVAISEGHLNAFQFSRDAYGSRSKDEGVLSVNTQIVEKFVREVSYRIDELNTELGDKQQIESSTLTTIFNYGSMQTYHGAVQNVQGGVQGSILAVDSNLSGVSIIYNSKDDLASAVKALGNDLTDVLQNHREEVSNAFALLVKAIENNTVPKSSQLATAVESIGEKTSSKLKSLKTIMEGAAGSLVAEALKPLLALELARLGINF